MQYAIEHLLLCHGKPNHVDKRALGEDQFVLVQILFNLCSFYIMYFHEILTVPGARVTSVDMSNTLRGRGLCGVC